VPTTVEKARKYQAARRARNPEHVRDIERRSRLKLKRQVFDHYGGVCQCCGEDVLEFLCIDHIEGGGTAMRREGVHRGGRHFYEWLKRNGFPDGYQVLCHNCNSAIGFYGYCPHQEGSRFAD
jgi:hypothetical protein